MSDLTISLPEGQMEKLRELSGRLGLSTEDLARIGVEDLLTGSDQEVDAHIDRILAKNRQLYDRLAG